tara:strand:+ start:271 stop:822 length:552 start_codon:yes stop_codon:yes gene_type:complete
MTDTNTLVQQTYRFKFSNDFKKIIANFAQINKEVQDKEEWDYNFDQWTKENKQIILEEQRRLDNNGYVGDISFKQGKIYKSARYYFKNKSNEKKQPKKRRVYVALDRDLLNAIDKDISNIINSRLDVTPKPHSAFTNFMKKMEYKDIINNEKERLSTKNLEDNDINDKIKKTYKNRYYNCIKK